MAALLATLCSCARPPVPAALVAQPGCVVPALPLTPAPPGTTDAKGFFPPSYEFARARFRQECARAVAQTSGFCRYVPIVDARDPDLTVDLAYLARPGNSNLLIFQSGLHGAEGFAGSAVQSRILHDEVGGLLERGFDVLMVHAINPYGFKNTRRVDACNVDLNRNFPATPSLYDTSNPAYETVSSLVERTGPVESATLASIAVKLNTALAALAHGFSTVAEGTHRGQYVNPAGFEFGGRFPAQQTALLRRELPPLIASHAGDVFFLDLHTGLGPRDSLTIYSGNGWPDESKTLLRALADDARRRWLASAHRPVAGTVRYQDPCESPFVTSGDVIDFVPGLADDNRVTAITVEWGTVGETLLSELETNARQTLEHQAYFQGCTSAATCTEIRRDFAQLFNPSDAAFQASVLDQADALVAALTAEPRATFRTFTRPDPTKACPR